MSGEPKKNNSDNDKTMEPESANLEEKEPTRKVKPVLTLNLHSVDNRIMAFFQSIVT